MARPGLGSLLLLGAAAYGAYRYSKMSDQQKKDLVSKGKKFVDDNVGGLKGAFGKRQNATAGNGASGYDGGFTQA
jgi:hypothetical protein